jgi:ADP-heptose:LPS heptosyltransferase
VIPQITDIMKVWFSNQLNAHKARQLANAWRGKPLAKIEPSKVRNVLVVELGGLGDAVNLFPVLEDLRARFSAAQFSIVCRDYAADLFKLRGGRRGGALRATENLTQVVGIEKSSSGVARALSAFGATEWDIVISTCWSTWTTMLAQKLRARALSGYWRPWRVESFGFNASSPPAVLSDDHLLLLRYKAVAPIGVEKPSPLPEPQIVVNDDAWKQVAQHRAWLASGFIVFVPFCGDISKSLSFDNAMSTLAMLRKLSERIALIGGRAEESGLESLAKMVLEVEQWDAKSKSQGADGIKLPVFTLTDFTIPQLAAALSKARFVMSVDTGAMHLAAAVGAPVIGVFRSTDPKKCGPRGERVAAIEVKELSQPQWKNLVFDGCGGVSDSHRE